MKTIKFNNEIAYKTIYEGYYVIKSGKVITVKKKGGQGKLDYSNPREHCYKIDRYGYKTVCLSNTINQTIKRKYITVHKLIYQTIYNTNVPADMTIDHIDGDKLNNNITNLQLLTREENVSKARKNKPSEKKYKYKLYKNGIYLGLYNRKQLEDKIGLKHKDYYQNTTRKKAITAKGYYWILESVEDIERIL